MINLSLSKKFIKDGLTQEDMIEFGFNYRHYQKIESGAYSMNLYTLWRLSVAFEVSIDIFFLDKIQPKDLKSKNEVTGLK